MMKFHLANTGHDMILQYYGRRIMWKQLMKEEKSK